MDCTNIFPDGVKVLCQSDRSKVVMESFHQEKGLGPRRLQQKLKKKYVGLSEPSISRALSQSEPRRLLFARFTNKAPTKPIVSLNVMGRMQYDLIDFTSNPAVYRGQEYKYILTAIDVFSRYTWLRPLRKKEGKLVARELEKIFNIFGNPRICQCDQGPEFRGEVDALLKDREITCICSRPRHPQSQGKIERSHGTLKLKLLYDLLMEESGTNWAKQLPQYERLLNDTPKKVLGWWTPFDVFYGRSKAGSLGNECEKIRNEAAKATRKEAENSIRASVKKLKTPIYEVGDHVLVRIKSGNSRISKAKVMRATVEQRNVERHMYKVKFCLNRYQKSKWVPVSDLTGSTLDLQKERESNTLRQQSPFHSAIVFDLLPDGNCQFSAVAYALQSHGIHRSGETLRQEVVAFLSENYYLGNQNNVPWREALDEDPNSFIHRMSQTSTFGDAITLQAMAEMYHIQIIVDSTLAHGATILSPSGHTEYDENLPSITLGHYHEGAGTHYVVLNNNPDLTLQSQRGTTKKPERGKQNTCSKTTMEKPSASQAPECTTR